MNDIPEEQSYPVWANEKIEIVEANPNWLAIGEQEIEKLLSLLSKYGINDIQHYGSTSIPNLAAKPIIDLMAKTDTFQKTNTIASVLANYDWHFVPPHLDNRPWQRFFVKVIDGKRVAHLHIMLEGEERWDKQLLFRDLLLNSQQLVNQYTILKKELSTKYKNDREEYTKAKTEFINYVLNSKL
ncbi:GrpB family protein [Cytobacillus suaedae]|nr:GrpB family protein [Cytobacillus suaedae]